MTEIPRRLTVDEIMSPSFVGETPSKVRWSGDGSRIYFEWRPAGFKEPAQFYVLRTGGEPTKLDEEGAKSIPPTDAEYLEDRNLAVFIDEGDIAIIDTVSGKRRNLVRTEDKELEAHFTKDEKKVYFLRDNNVYSIGLDTGCLTQITDIQPSRLEPAEKTKSQEWLESQQKELFQVLKEEKEKRPPRKAFYTKQNQRIADTYLSHDERTLVFTLKEEPQQGKATLVPRYVTKSGYTEDLQSRKKVGDVVEKRRMGVYRTESGEVAWVDHGQGDREVDLFFVAWSPDGNSGLLVGQSSDFKDRWFLTLDPRTAEARAIEHLHDDAWVKRGSTQDAGWMPDGSAVYFLSESDGYQHLYVTTTEKGERRQLTRGEFEVFSPKISRDKTRWYFHSNERDLGELHFYTMPLQGGKMTRITELEGRNEAFISPDESMLAVIHSFSNTPSELYLQANEPNSVSRRATLTTSEAFRSYPWIVPRIVVFRARDGALVRARLYRPTSPQARGPAVVFVHGAGYMQNVHKWWSTYYREYMFHHILMERGYTCLDIDYRGSAGYGRDWRTAIFQHMGDKDLSDQVDGAQYLVQEQGVDPNRIGIYGGSYGGFITLMALFTAPDVFAAGAALRPVTDWAHYSHDYTGRILNLPHADDDSYRKSSPIYFAEGLRKPLLICHGMVDTNVHFQDTVRLVQRLIELKKENWDVAIYPVEDHGFKNESSWCDEYKRILQLFETHLWNP